MRDKSSSKKIPQQWLANLAGWLGQRSPEEDYARRKKRDDDTCIGGGSGPHGRSRSPSPSSSSPRGGVQHHNFHALFGPSAMKKSTFADSPFVLGRLSHRQFSRFMTRLGAASLLTVIIFLLLFIVDPHTAASIPLLGNLVTLSSEMDRATNALLHMNVTVRRRRLSAQSRPSLNKSLSSSSSADGGRDDDEHIDYLLDQQVHQLYDGSVDAKALVAAVFKERLRQAIDARLYGRGGGGDGRDGDASQREKEALSAGRRRRALEKLQPHPEIKREYWERDEAADRTTNNGGDGGDRRGAAVVPADLHGDPVAGGGRAEDHHRHRHHRHFKFSRNHNNADSGAGGSTDTATGATASAAAGADADDEEDWAANGGAIAEEAAEEAELDAIKEIMARSSSRGNNQLVGAAAEDNSGGGVLLKRVKRSLRDNLLRVGGGNSNSKSDGLIAASLLHQSSFRKPLYSTPYAMREVFDDDASIFVSISQFKDILCPFTIQELYTKARNPRRIFAGIVDQREYNLNATVGGVGSPPPASIVDPNRLDVNLDGTCFPWYMQSKCGLNYFCPIDNIRVRHAFPHEGKGPTWGRYYGMLMYQGESYFMMIDSHSRFAKNYDVQIMINLLMVKRQNPSGKVVLSHYPSNFERYETLNSHRMSNVMMTMCSGHFLDVGIIRMDSKIAPLRGYPAPQPFSAGGFLVGDAQFVHEVPFDPYLTFVFDGEEVLYSVRLWTHGYNTYTPRNHILFHNYARVHAPRFWTTLNDSYWKPLNWMGQARVKYFMKTFKNQTEELMVPPALAKRIGVDKEEEIYGLGKVRTLEGFYRYARVDPVKWTVNGGREKCGQWLEDGEFYTKYHNKRSQAAAGRSRGSDTAEVLHPSIGGKLDDPPGERRAGDVPPPPTMDAEEEGYYNQWQILKKWRLDHPEELAKGNSNRPPAAAAAAAGPPRPQGSVVRVALDSDGAGGEAATLKRPAGAIVAAGADPHGSSPPPHLTSGGAGGNAANVNANAAAGTVN